MTDAAGNTVFAAANQRRCVAEWFGVPGAEKLNGGRLRLFVQTGSGQLGAERQIH